MNQKYSATQLTLIQVAAHKQTDMQTNKQKVTGVGEDVEKQKHR